MCYNSQGGFTWRDVYSMPVYLRSFYVKQLIETKKKEEAEMKKAQNKSKTPSMPNMPRR